MSFETKIDAGVMSIKVSGRFDFGMHKEFRDASNRIDAGLKKIEVDLSSTSYMDSSALGMLLVLRDKVAGNKDVVVIKGASAEVRKILQIANFDKLFTLI